ncbi:helix-turn-helix domain-containing protein, partial [Candidatus Woesebacteria bacterium]|nr:helix-turn-helix domain-containing protein [Candidatus Woesebacteria bacterium]
MKKIPAQTKKEIVRKALYENASISDLSRGYSISRKAIYNWINKYKKESEDKSKAFIPQYAKGRKHPKAKAHEIEKKLLRIVADNPKITIKQLSSKVPVSSWTVWKILDQNNLNTKDKRTEFADTFEKQNTAAEEKREAVIRAVEENESVTKIAKELDVARKTVYSWIKRYKKAKDLSLKTFQPRYVSGEKHPNAKVSDDLEKKLLEIVTEDPDLAISELANSLPVSAYTVWKLLDKHNLNTISQREYYALQTSQALEKRVPFASILDSFGYVRKELELLLQVSRKIPKTVDLQLISPIKSYLSTLIISTSRRLSLYINSLSNYLRFVIRKASFALDQLVNDVGRFTLNLSRFTLTRPRHSYYYATLVLLIVLSLGFADRIVKLIPEETVSQVSQRLSENTRLAALLSEEEEEQEVERLISGNYIIEGDTDLQVTGTPKFKITKVASAFEVDRKDSIDLSQVTPTIKPEVTITGPSGQNIKDFSLQETNEGEFEVILSDFSKIKPGLYVLGVSDETGTQITQNFSWGILAINTNQTTYNTDENIEILITVLDSKGIPKCDADLALVIRNTENDDYTLMTTADNEIKVNDGCETDQKTTEPDYSASLSELSEGEYEVELIASIDSTNHKVSSGFKVAEESELADFEVSRAAPIKVASGEDYPVVIRIKANKDHKGQVIDKVPSNFLVKPFGKAKIEIDPETSSLVDEEFSVKVNGENEQLLIWDVDFKAGGTYSLTYAFSDMGSDWTNYYLGPVEIEGAEVDKIWEFRQDPSAPAGKVTQKMRYGRVRVEEKMLEIRGRKMKTFMEKAHVKAGETPKIVLEDLTLSDSGSQNPGLMQRLLGIAQENVDDSQFTTGIKIEVIDNDGNREYVTNIEQITETVEIPPQYLKPGRHIVTITDVETGNFVEQEFLYGVLALNLNKSVYSLGESTYIQMASLDDGGQTVCDSNLELTVYDPEGGVETYSMQEGTISVSDECLLNNVTDEPDYFVYYPINNLGEYRTVLTNLENGYSVDGNFLVEESPQYSIERVGATRINPFKAKYVMTFNVESKDNFSGELIETVPDGFQISESDEFSVNGQEILWSLELNAGEQQSFIYEYQAPKVSPELYLLGEARLVNDGNEVFSEYRKWQLASDATIYITSGTSWQVPSDWNDSDNTVEVIGGGGGGANGAAESGGNGGVGGGGGGGGGYAIATNVDLTPDDYVTVQVGQGGTVGNPGTQTYFNGGSCATSSVCATGGGAASGATGGTAGTYSVGTGYSGGSGGGGGGVANAGGGGGGGGGAGGPNAAGDGGTIGSSASGNSGGAGGGGGQGDGTSGGSGGTGGTAGGGTGGNGGNGTEWDSTHGSGGGSGGGGGGSRNGNGGPAGTAGTYGAGGAGGGGEGRGGTTFGSGASGRNGLIVVDYTPPPNSPPTINVDEPDGSGDEIAEGANFTVQYDLEDTDDTVTADFYYDTDGSGLDGVAISGCQDQPEDTDNTCTWDTTGVTPGTYYVYGVTSDGVNPQQSDYSSGVVTINDAPTINVDEPDGTSDEIAEGANFTVQYDLDDTDDLVTADFYYDTNGSGLDGVAISGCAGQGEATNGTCSWDTTGVTPGTYYVYGTVSDSVNSQVSDYSAGVVTINDAPTINVDEPDGAGDEIAEGANFTVQYDLADSDDSVTADFYYDTDTTGLNGVAISGCSAQGEGTNQTCSWDTTGVTPGTYYIYGTVDDGVNSPVSDYSSGVVTINDTPTITVDEPDGVGDTILEGANFTVQYDLDDTDDLVTADFYYDTDDLGLNGSAIAGCQDQDEDTDNTCTWDTTGVIPGTYYVYGIVDDGVNSPVSDYSSGVVTINDAPDITVDEPDGAGDEIAEGANFTVQYDLADTDNDVTADFYYDTDDSGLDGSAISSCTGQGEGINQTCIWDTTGVTPGTYYVYGIVDDGTNPQQDDYSSGVVTINDAPTINVDEPDGVSDTIQEDANFTVQYDLADTDDDVTADFYYDTDSSGLDGVAISGCAGQGEGTDQTCIWDTNGVTPGTYYVYGIVDDGVNSAVDDYSSGVVTITDAPDITVDEPDGVSDEVTEGDNFTVQYDLADTDDDVTADFYYDSNDSGLDGTAISGCQNQGEGTDQTCIWDTTGITPGNYYVYGVADDGYNPAQNDYSSGVVTIISGSNDPPTINVDEPDGVSDEIAVDANFTVQYDLDDTDDTVTADFYYDTNSTGLDGVAISGCQNEAEGTDQTCTWDTTGVSAGTYYVYGIVDDGTNPPVDDYSSGVVTINDAPTINVDEPDGVSDEIGEGTNFTVQYDLDDIVDTVTADFYYDSDSSGLDGVAISGCQDQGEGTNETCTWDTTGVSPGTYYVYGIVDDGFNAQQDDYSSGVVTINDAPEINVDEPDGISDEITEGANFTVQYDLADTDDDVTADFYYDANATGLDGTLIAGCQTQAEGTNQTCTWDTTGVSPGAYYVYGIVDDGVNSSDDNYSAGVVTINDSPDITVDEPDGVSDEIAEGANFTVQYDLSDTDDTVTADFYYDTDSSGLDGVAIAGCAGQGEGINQTCSWDTTGVSPGTYYVYGVSYDGFNPSENDYSSGVVTINDPPTINVDQPDGVSDEIAEGANF